MFFSTGKWKSFLVVYMIVCYLMDLTSTWANVIISFVLCLSLTINSLPKSFVEWIQYAWYSSGYTNNHPGSFKTVSEVCFSIDDTMCSMPSCDACPFICCSLVWQTTMFSTTFLSITTFTDFLCEEFFELYWHWKWNEELWVLYGLISYKQKCCR